MSKRISLKQQKFSLFLKNFISSHGQSPTFEEIKEGMGIKHNSTVVYYIKQLEEAGLIYREEGSRGICLKESIGFSKIPVLGYANAGYPTLLAEEDLLGYVTVDSRILKNEGNVFSLIINGDSMDLARVNQKNLLDGKYAIIDKNREYADGNIVLALIDNAATIKKLNIKNKSVILEPVSSNKNHFPIFISDNENLFINGVVVDVL